MASSLLRATGSLRLTQVAGPALLKHLPATSVLPKKTLSLTPVNQRRIYGPAEGLPSYLSHWKNERIVMFSLYPLVPIGCLFPNTVLDYALSIGVLLHAHWGLSSVVTDYLHGQFLHPIGKYGVMVGSILAFAGLAYLNMHDMGFGHTIKYIFTQL